MGHNDTILKIIKNRRTVRKFNTKKIPIRIIKKIIDIARWAPCPNNLQPWNFFISKNNSPITAKIVKYIEKKSKVKNIGVSIFLNDAVRILKTANIVIYVFNTKIVAKKYAILGKQYQKKASLFENQSIAAAIENLILVAEVFKLGTVWLGSPVFLSKGIERIFETDYELSAIIGMGYYDHKPKRTSRLSVNEILTFL